MSWGPHKDSQRCSLSLCICGPYRLTAIGFRSGSTIMSHCFKMNYKLSTRSLNQSRVLRLLENYDDEFVIKKKKPEPNTATSQAELIARRDGERRDRQPTLTSTSAHFRCSRARLSRQQRRQVSAASADDGDGGLSLAKKGNRCCCLNLLLLLFKTTQCAGNLTHTYTRTPIHIHTHTL